MSSAFLKSVLAGFASAFDPLREAVASPARFQQFLAEFGWALSATDLNAVLGSLASLPASDGDPADKTAGQLTDALVEASQAIYQIARSNAPAAFVSTFPHELLDHLVYFALAKQRPAVFSLLHFVGVLTEQTRPADPATGRAGFVLRQVHWDWLSGLGGDPVQTVKDTYGWGNNFRGDGFIRSLGVLIRGFGGNASLQPADRSLVAQYYAPDTPGRGGIQNLIISVPGLARSATAGSGRVGGRIALLAMPIPARADAAGPVDGLTLMPIVTGEASDTFPISDHASLKLTGDMLARPVRAELHPGRSIVRATAGDAHVGAAARLDAQAPAGAPWIALGAVDSSRLEIAATHASVGLSGELDGDLDFSVEVGVDTATLVIDLGDVDPFVKRTAGSRQPSAPFAFTLRWSSRSGFSISGSPNLSVVVPLHRSLGGTVTLQSIGLALGGETDRSGVNLDGTVALSASIGPLGATISGVGFRVALVRSDDPSHPGNLGNAHVTYGLKPPDGVGLTIDAAGLNGGGFLAHDDATHEYRGALQLVFDDVVFQAFGLITTQVAGGDGYALLALIDAEFPPVQLGWGFTLDGVGGLLAVHRSASVDALRAALKANTLSSILFPKNAITNAPQVLATLDAIFPTAPGRFLFGPMARISWGGVVTAELAIIVELPEPIRIVLIARIAARLPSEASPLVRINLDALGVLDLGQDSLSLDATLFDSKLLAYTLSGDMALRASWGASPRGFLLAIGGFHPQFSPPAGFPALKRITIDMPSGSVSKLRLAAYLAISSNTLQLGATLDVFIGVAGFGLSGHLGFDALLQLDPFHFDADISGHVALTAGGDDLMSVGLDATLSGPAPWHIAGNFKIHVVFFDVHKSFSHGWGDAAPSQPFAPVAVLPLLAAALADPRSWGTGLPSGTSALVSLRAPEAGTPFGHPLARLEVLERVVPLGLAITRFGPAPVSGATSFTLSDLRVNGAAIPHEAIQDDFAPAQFFELSDDEKLARPSFERHDAGVRSTGGLVACGAPIAKTIAYETYYVDAPGGALRTDPVTPPRSFVLGDLAVVLSLGASGRAAIRAAGNGRYTAPGAPVRIAPQRFVVADCASLRFAGIGPAQGATYSEARAALDAALAQAPARRATTQIVAAHELTAA